MGNITYSFLCLLVLITGARITLAYECITAANSARVQDIMEATAVLREMGKKICPDPSKLLRRAKATECTVVLTYRTVQIALCGPWSVSLPCQELATEVDALRERCLKFTGGTLRARGYHFIGGMRIDLEVPP